MLDGDNVRHGLNAGPGMLRAEHGEEFAKRFGLGFSPRTAKRTSAASARWPSSSAMPAWWRSPLSSARTAPIATGSGCRLAPDDFIEIFVVRPLGGLREGHPKGLYKKARAGELKGFTGIDDPYEPPVKPEMVLDAGQKTADQLADEVITYLRTSGRI